MAQAPSYLPRLDTFRAIAALMIVYHHYFAEVMPIQLNTAQGVSFFFVLSGYLITNLLLHETGSAGEILGRFYIRRTFRIFPLYYFVLVIGLAFDVPGFRSSLPWTALYLTNVDMILRNDWIGNASHLWTLAVEEQFYLLWPLALLASGRKVLIFAVIFILASLTYRFLFQPGRSIFLGF
jgi:peptidoglycan/LPS O-acetylase OafA/YrhL